MDNSGFFSSLTATPGGSLESIIQMSQQGSSNQPLPAHTPAPDYDYSGYVAKYGVPDQSKGQHLTDEFKLPNHITFSQESRYATTENPGGKWQKEAGKWHFYARASNLKYHTPEELKSYFKRWEPNSVLHLPSDEAR